jgi:DNA modification methylase
VVFDPFGGSGSTLIACETTGRQARVIEIDPRYVDVIVKRWQDYTGRKAVLDGDGGEFEQIALERSCPSLEGC